MVFLLGTKGQLIKTAGVMREAGDYTYIQTNQHPVMNRELERLLGLKSPDLHLSGRSNDLRTPLEIPGWFLGCFWNLFRNRRFLKKERILVTQGDTLTTLFAALAAKVFGLKLAHVEAGLRSYSILHPFPEEIVRRFVSKFATYLFAPGRWATQNLKNERGVIVDTAQNTVYDVLGEIAVKKEGEKHIVAAIHRQETIYNRPRLETAVSVVKRASRIAPVLYVLHRPSEHQLKRFGFYDDIANDPRISIRGYYDYISFMQVVANSVFVISDGGGLQEETYFLDVPCLLLRNRTERRVGLGITALLSEMKEDRITYFLENYDSFHRKGDFTRLYPSRLIARMLQNEERSLS
jgi:UDP-N-acetylglucosamine 2-epimerase (non-hydrolysing)